MKIAMISGSPKTSCSASEELLRELKECLKGDVIYKDYRFNKIQIVEGSTIEELGECDALVFSFPLYVDGIPAHLLSCLIELYNAGIANKDIIVYGISNAGFYEGKQNSIALGILENWCARVGLKWGGGVGVGGGGGLLQMENIPIGKGMKSSLGKAFTKLGESIINATTIENIYISMNLPRWLYKIMAEIGWKSQFKETGDKTKKIGHRY